MPAMTNSTIILNHAFKLMEAGIIAGSGEYGIIERADGTTENVEFPEAIHTFQRWKELGRSVKRGEKAVDSFQIWKCRFKQLDTDTGNDSLNAINAEINERGGERNMFLQFAAFFTEAQTEPTAEREARREAKKTAKAAKKAAEAEAPAPDIESDIKPAIEAAEAPEAETVNEAAEIETAPEVLPELPPIVPHYYTINEKAARLNKEMMSYDDYKPNNATDSYRAEVNEATKIYKEVLTKCKTEAQREHAARLYDRYCKKLAEYINKNNEIGTRCPSIMIAGGSNFPGKKKQKQVAAWDANERFYRDEVQTTLYKLRGVYRQGIKATDPEALEVLNQKLAKLEMNREQAKVKNAAARKAGQETPFPTWYFSNLSAKIRSTKKRIEELEAMRNTDTTSEECAGFTYEENSADARVRFIFTGKPDGKTREVLKSNGFRWSPSTGSWQRQLNENGKWAARRVKEALQAIA